MVNILIAGGFTDEGKTLHQTTEDVHQVYHEVVEFIKERDMNICIGEKSLAAIMYKVNQQKRAEETLSYTI